MRKFFFSLSSKATPITDKSLATTEPRCWCPPSQRQKRAQLQTLSGDVYPVVAMVMGPRRWSSRAWPQTLLDDVHDSLIERILEGEEGESTSTCSERLAVEHCRLRCAKPWI